MGNMHVHILRVLKECRTFTIVEVRLETGRTHQIRVHISYLGHPITWG